MSWPDFLDFHTATQANIPEMINTNNTTCPVMSNMLKMSPTERTYSGSPVAMSERFRVKNRGPTTATSKYITTAFLYKGYAADSSKMISPGRTYSVYREYPKPLSSECVSVV